MTEQAHYPLARERVDTLDAMTGLEYAITRSALRELIRDANQSRRNGEVEYRTYLRACLGGAETTEGCALITLF